MTAERDLSMRQWSGLLAVVVVGFLLRLVLILVLNIAPRSDELEYKSMALNIVSGNGVLDHSGNHAYYNAGYPMFVLAPVFYAFGENLFAARLANLVLGLVAIVLCYLVSREAGAGRTGAILGAGVWTLYLPSGLYTMYLYKEHLMIPLVLGVTWCGLRLMKGADLRVALACGVLFGFIALTGNAAISLGGAVAFGMVLSPLSMRRRAVLSMVIVIAAILIAAPWVIRNVKVLGAPVLNSNGGINLYLGNNPTADGWYMSIADTPRGSTWNPLRQQLGELGASQVLQVDAVAWIKEHPHAFLKLAAKKAIYFWTPPFHKGEGSGSTSETIARTIWAFEYIAIVLVALGGLALKTCRTRSMVFLWVALLCYTAVHMLFYVNFRYREPVMPLLGIIAGLSLERLVAHRANAFRNLQTV